MLRKPASEQTAIEMVMLESLVPKDHFVPQIDGVIDFSFMSGSPGFIVQTTAARRSTRP